MGRDLRGRPHRHARRFVTNPASATQAYQFLGAETYKQTSTEPIPTVDVTMKMLFEIDEPKPGAGGKVTLWANDKQIGEGTMPQTVALLYTTYAGMDLGRDNGGVVDLAYEDNASYAFTGTVKNVVIDLKPATHTPARHEDEKALHGWKGKRTGATGQACRPAGPRSSRAKGISEERANCGLSIVILISKSSFRSDQLIRYALVVMTSSRWSRRRGWVSGRHALLGDRVGQAPTVFIAAVIPATRSLPR